MASVRPSVPRSASHQRLPRSDKNSLRPLKEDLRSRSHSRTPPSKLYNADGPKYYTSNESRARKPPPSPTVEDQGFGPEEVRMRGKPDQTPMLIRIGSDSSSPDSNGPETPESSSDSGQETRVRFSDDEEVFESNTESYTYDKRAPGRMRAKDGRRARSKGSRERSRVGRSSSNKGSPTPPIERARSPYSYRPKQEAKTDSKRQPTAQLLTPDSPRVGDQSRRLEPQIGPVPARHLGATHTSHTQPGILDAKGGSKRPARPLFERRASAMPQLGSPVAARSRYVENSSDESDIELLRGLRARSGQLTSDALPTSASYFDTPRRSGRHSVKPTTPPQTPPISTENARGPLMNRESLINGPALQHLSTALESSQRQASPRVSPQNSPRPSPSHSPNASPYPSPPQTPLERHHKRSSTVEVLQKQAPGTSSPLSSRPSSPRPGVQTFAARQIDYDARPPPMMSKERRTSTWDSSQSANTHHHRSAQVPSQSSSGSSRPSSPERRRPDRTASYDINDSTPQFTRQGSYASEEPKDKATLKPSEPRRHRVPSSEDLRKALPQLSTKHADLDQDTSSPKTHRARQKSGSYVPATADPALGASLGAGLLSPSSSHRSHSTAPESHSHRRHRSRSRTASDVRNAPRSQSSAPKEITPASDQRQPVLLPQCPRPEAVAGYEDWYALDRQREMLICPECRHSNFGKGWEQAFRPASGIKRSTKIKCSMNDPWVRLGCLDAFGRQRADTRLLAMLTEVTEEEPACPGSQLEEGRTWYHLRDNETGRDFNDFHICSHCVYSLEVIYPRLGDIFHRTKDLKKGEARVCNLRSDVHRFGKYLNAFVTMAKEAEALPKNATPPTSDFIWEVKWMTIISPCNGAAVHYGQDMHLHPDLPQLTICEECYYKTVRPLLKTTRKDPGHFIHRIAPETKEIVGGSTCKLYSARMKQIFTTAVEDRDWDYFAKAVKKRSELLQDLEEAKAAVTKSPTEEAKGELDYLKGKWDKLERKHD